MKKKNKSSNSYGINLHPSITGMSGSSTAVQKEPMNAMSKKKKKFVSTLMNKKDKR